MAESFDSRLAKVNNAAAQKGQMEQILAPYMNWHKFLTTAPASVAILGNILLIAGEKDFTLEEATPTGGFKFIKYPRSFRASLVQLVNESHAAMLQSHTKMDQIRLYALNVPPYLKECVKLLAQGSTQHVEVMLPTHLKKIEETALNCKKLALEVEQGYTNVTFLISELLEATVAADGHYTIKQEENASRHTAAEMEDKRLEEDQKESKRQVEKMEKEVREKQKELKDAFENQTSGWELIGMGVVENLSRGLATGMEVAAQAVAAKMNPVGSAIAMGSNALEASSSGQAEMAPTPHTDRKALQKIQMVHKVSTALANFVTASGDLDTNAILNEGSGAMTVIAQLDKLSQGMDQEQPSQADVIELCQTGRAISKELFNLAKSLIGNPEKTKSLESSVKTFCNQMINKNMVAAALLNNNPMTPPGPRQQAVQRTEGAKTVVQSVVEQDRAKVETYKGLLEVSQNRYDAAVQQQKEAYKAMMDNLKELASLKIDSLNFEEIKTVLRNAIILLGGLKKEWTNLAMFFSTIANIVKVTMTENLMYFKSISDDQRKLVLSGVTYDDIMRDQMYNQAMQSNILSHFVHHIASNYCNISAQHVMPQVSALPRLCALDAVKDRDTIIQEKDKLTKDCNLAQEAICQLVNEDHNKFRADMEELRRTVDSELGNLLAKPEQATVAAITNAVLAVKLEERDIQFSNIDLDDFC